jgi:hypothetical protein
MDQLQSTRDGIRTRRTDSATFKRIAPGAPFISQLIGRRPVTAGPQLAAAAAYALGGRMAVRRLPPGYRTRRDA